MESFDEKFAFHRKQNMTLVDRLIYRDQSELLDRYPESTLAAEIIRDLELFATSSGLLQKLTNVALKKINNNIDNLSIIEVCGGSCWLLRSVISKIGHSEIYSVGSDLSQHHIETNKAKYNKRNIHWLVADATDLPERDLRFDLSLNCQALHHFSPHKVVKILKEMNRASKKAIIFDLRRTFYGPLMMKLLSPFYSSFFISDGIASHRRAYSIQEMKFIIKSANLPYKISHYTPVGMLLESI
jgi:ubiquinone/menaquinone biosynthesis C-methylase UbiE